VITAVRKLLAAKEWTILVILQKSARTWCHRCHYLCQCIPVSTFVSSSRLVLRLPWQAARCRQYWQHSFERISLSSCHLLDIAPCRPYINRRFGEMYHFHLYGQTSAEPPAARWFLARLMSDHKDGGGTFFRNVGPHTVYMALYSRKWQES
jgi:hypothetical protein